MPCQAARNSTLMPAAKNFNLKVTGIMKKLFYSLAVLAAVTACNKEIEQQPAPVVGEGVDFIATFEDADTRVYLGEDYFYRWEAGDLGSVFTGSNHDQYKAASGDVVETTLEYVSTTAALGSALSENYALYPYDAAAAINDGVISTTLPTEQTYNSAVPTGINNAIMVSQASGTEFVFKNSCALVKVNLKVAADFSAQHSVRAIRVLSKDHALSGPVSVNVAGGDYAAKVDGTSSSSSKYVRLTGCESAGLLDTESVLTFYLAIPAGTYAAGDLTVFVTTTSASSTSFNQSFNLTKQYTVNRSQYIEVTATMGKGYDWFEENDDEVIIKEDVILVDKAIMCDEDNLLRQNFRGHDSYDKVFDIPSGDFSITGAQLVESGDASEGPSGPTITFKKTDAEVFIVNTFTTTTSGLSSTTDVNTVTVSNLTITGELQSNCMGIYVNDKGDWGPGYSQSTFHTVWNDVNVLDCKIIPFNSVDKKLGAAVCVYGKAELNNCTIKGTEKSPYVDTHYPEYSDFPYYDMACTNKSHTIVTGGEIGSIFGWEQAKYTFGGGAVIGSLYTIGISASNLGPVIVNDATVGELTMDPAGNYAPYLTLSTSAKVGTLTFVDDDYVGYWGKVKILTGASVDKVVLEGVGEYTLAEFISTYNIATN